MLYKRELPAPRSWDVIVIGGGPSGCAAASAAAREGKNTLLIEATGCLGGMGTSGLVPAWCPYSDGEKVIYGGLAYRVFKEANRSFPHVMNVKDWWDWVPIDAEALKRVYDELVAEFGVHVLYFTQVVDVQLGGGNRVESIICANKAGLSAHTAPVFIDCTGDGDIAVMAGARWVKGDDTGDMQPATHCFVLTNVDDYGFVNGPDLHPQNPQSPIYEIAHDPKYPEIPDVHLCHAYQGGRTVAFNAGHLWDVDNTDPESISRAMPKGRRIAKALRDALAEYVPETFAASKLIATAPLMGVRETRRITGRYVLTVEDYLARRSFDDEIGRNCYFIDVHHNPQQAETASTADGNVAMQVHTHRYEKGESHGIPYRCLTPQGLPNVLVAGRSISCDRPVQGSVRVMPPCLVTGEAAGVAASLALLQQVPDVTRVDTGVLRDKLRAHGAYLP